MEHVHSVRNESLCEGVFEWAALQKAHKGYTHRMGLADPGQGCGSRQIWDPISLKTCFTNQPGHDTGKRQDIIGQHKRFVPFSNSSVVVVAMHLTTRSPSCFMAALRLGLGELGFYIANTWGQSWALWKKPNKPKRNQPHNNSKLHSHELNQGGRQSFRVEQTVTVPSPGSSSSASNHILSLSSAA